jgi:hypothetical protein
MKKITVSGMSCLVLLVVMAVMSTLAAAGDVKPYAITFPENEKFKAWLNDPAPYYTNNDYFKKVIPPEIYAQISYDPEKMKAVWEECVGFKAPDVVGKIAPEIKPGKYTWQDKQKYPFDKIMWKEMYDRFNPSGQGTPNHVGNFTEIEIVPTRQYYWALPIAEATKKNMGKCKQDSQGYLLEDTYEGGYPFPRPSGPFMAQQFMYNWNKKYIYGQDYHYLEHILGVNKYWKQDWDALGQATWLRLQGRAYPPYGWLDERGKKQGEQSALIYRVLGPRDLFGNILSVTNYTDPNKYDLYLYYVNMLRRIRRLSASDTQDPAVGQDVIFEDPLGFGQKLSPTRWPYTYKVIGEQEYLVPMTWDGTPYIDANAGYTQKLVQFERRPVVVVELDQTDPNYVYSKRILYFDKETLLPIDIQNYDQKGRLYRTWDNLWAFLPPLGQYNQFNVVLGDHVDIHSSWYSGIGYEAKWIGREDTNLGAMLGSK